jgi:hypothetical protein
MLKSPYILCAAIWYKDLPTQNFLPKNVDRGLVVCGHRHAHCIDVVKSLSGLRTVRISPDGVGESVQGFLTDTNMFVGREEAAEIAISCGQIEKTNYGKQLYSEDLY